MAERLQNGLRATDDAERFRRALGRRHLAAQRGRAASRERAAAPVQYDESGYPVRTASPNFGERVRRLLFS